MGDLKPLDSLSLVVVVDNETDMLSSIDNTVQTSESATIVRTHTPFQLGDAACVSVLDHLCSACHGFSVLLTGRRAGQEHTMLFDVGPYGDVWLANAERLRIDLSSIELVFLSHWHWDHSGGFVAVVEAIAAERRARGFAPPVVDVHPDRPLRRGGRLGDGRVAALPEDPTFEALERAGAVVERHGEARGLLDGFFFASGEIPRVTAFETGLVGHQTLRDGRFEPDPLIMDERYVAAQVEGGGLAVLSACSHAGIVNVASDVVTRFDAPLDLLLGGYHLAGAAMEPRIGDTLAALMELDPMLVAPGHCTGWRAKAALAGAFEPTGRYAPSVVGTRYTF